MSDLSCNHYVFLIHGTWGRSEIGWYQKSENPSSFFQRLKKKFIGTHLEGMIWRNAEVFEWDGGNSHEDRLLAAERLSSLLLEIREKSTNVKFHFVAHSHGGNVVLKALEQYYIVRANSLRAGFLTTLGNRGIEKLKSITIDYGLLSQIGMSGVSLKEEFEQLEAAQNNMDGTKSLRLQSQRKSIELFTDLKERIAYLVRKRIISEIGSVVMMGTPFYYKNWKFPSAKRAFNYVFEVLILWLSVPMILYPLILGMAEIFSLFVFSLSLTIGFHTEMQSWIGFNPINWPSPFLFIFGVFLFVSVYVAVKEVWKRPKPISDSNIYFNLADFDFYAGQKLFTVLVIHGNFLDEAYTALSSYPTIQNMIHPVVRRFLKPTFYNFNPLKLRSGVSRESHFARAQLYATNIVRDIKAFIGIALFPVRVAFYHTMFTFTNRYTRQYIQQLALGLPAYEFVGANVLVKNLLKVDGVKSEEFDASLFFKGMKTDLKQEEERFKFLWDKQDLTKRMKHSAAKEFLGATKDVEEQRRILSIEERLKEVLGVAGMRHSLYYDNEVVVKRIADFMKGTL